MRLALVCVAVLAALCEPAFAAGNFSDWAAIVVAGDWHAHDGAPSEVFDNARRDITNELVQIGFSPANILQFSVRPNRYPAADLQASTAQNISDGMWDLSNQADGGCLAYFTSHGSGSGIVLGQSDLSPQQMSDIVDNACGTRPTVVIVSACYSGIFVPALQAPNRIVLTAAAADRASFGCGQSDKYTYFDACAVQWLARAGDFRDFGKDVIACVDAREKKDKVGPPSDPQFYIGAHNHGTFPSWK
ncbi:MAG: peptidase C13 [Alphaproteobacteria bacterium]|nr:peptidase C13 [Alphaproteobacteria bacterium]MDE2267222.1 peptidase C13 [Alphaproteobacteria bacterium]MDE2499806.1 peptidase C13 [Alphaproteobacteria bacterium]